jgi:hypothetical protein
MQDNVAKNGTLLGMVALFGRSAMATSSAEQRVHVVHWKLWSTDNITLTGNVD